MTYEYIATEDYVSILFEKKQVARLRGKKARDFLETMQGVQDVDAQAIMRKMASSYEQRLYTLKIFCIVSSVMLVLGLVAVYFIFKTIGLPNQTDISPIAELSPEAVSGFEERLRELYELSPNYQHPAIAEVTILDMVPPTSLHAQQVTFKVAFDIPDFYGAYIWVDFYACSAEAQGQLYHYLFWGRAGGYRQQSFVENDNDTSATLFRVRYNTNLRVANIYFHETFSMIRIGNGLFLVGNSVNVPGILDRTENFRRWDFGTVRQNAAAASEVIEIVSTIISDTASD